MDLTIQECLKDLRVERGLTLEQLAEETHLSKSALGSYEADEYKDISHYALIKLAKFYGVTADYLLGLTETRNHPNADLADLRLSVEKAVCGEFGNNDDTWTWCYLDVREALPKAKDELLMKLESDERLVVGTAYFDQNLRTGKILELVPAEEYLEIGGVKYGDYKEELLRIEPADFSSWPEGTPEHIFGDV